MFLFTFYFLKNFFLLYFALVFLFFWTIRPKPIDILAVVILTHHVCKQNLKAAAAHMVMNDDTGQEDCDDLVTEPASRNCFGISFFETRRD